jgi:hypothetical protein
MLTERFTIELSNKKMPTQVSQKKSCHKKEAEEEEEEDDEIFFDQTGVDLLDSISKKLTQEIENNIKKKKEFSMSTSSSTSSSSSSDSTNEPTNCSIQMPITHILLRCLENLQKNGNKIEWKITGHKGNMTVKISWKDDIEPTSHNKIDKSKLIESRIKHLNYEETLNSCIVRYKDNTAIWNYLKILRNNLVNIFSKLKDFFHSKLNNNRMKRDEEADEFISYIHSEVISSLLRTAKNLNSSMNDNKDIEQSIKYLIFKEIGDYLKVNSVQLHIELDKKINNAKSFNDYSFVSSLSTWLIQTIEIKDTQIGEYIKKWVSKVNTNTTSNPLTDTLMLSLNSLMESDHSTCQSGGEEKWQDNWSMKPNFYQKLEPIKVKSPNKVNWFNKIPITTKKFNQNDTSVEGGLKKPSVVSYSNSNSDSTTSEIYETSFTNDIDNEIHQSEEIQLKKTIFDKQSYQFANFVNNKRSKDFDLSNINVNNKRPLQFSSPNSDNNGSKSSNRFKKDNTNRIIPDKDINDPKFDICPSDRLVRLGESAKFFCQINGTKPLEVFWYKLNSDKELENDEKYEIFNDENTNFYYLKINNVTEFDSGLYLCIISNDIEQNIDSFYLKTRPNNRPFTSPKFLIKMQDIEVEEGQSSTFLVQIDFGYPKARILFYRNNQLLYNDKKHHICKFVILSIFKLILENNKFFIKKNRFLWQWNLSFTP